MMKEIHLELDLSYIACRIYTYIYIDMLTYHCFFTPDISLVLNLRDRLGV